MVKTLKLNLLRIVARIVYLDAQISDGAFELRVTERTFTYRTGTPRKGSVGSLDRMRKWQLRPFVLKFDDFEPKLAG
jgi:hypothetical protein